MSPLREALLKGYDKYYRTLTQVGFINTDQVNRLIITTWINDVLEGKYGFIVNDEQYNLLDRLYNCVNHSCLLPYNVGPCDQVILSDSIPACPSTSGDTFIYIQSPAATVWTIEHPLDRYPSVTIVNDNNEVIVGAIEYQNNSVITVTFNTAIEGRAFLN